MHRFRRSRFHFNRRTIIVAVGSLIAVLIMFLLTYSSLFGPVDRFAGQVSFIVKPDESLDEVVSTLKSEGFIHNEWAFRFAYLRAREEKSLRPGGYTLSASEDTWTIAEILGKKPYLAWVTFPPGYRKEQIADVLVDDLGWTEEQKQEWQTIDTATSADLVEGVYLPDTYLIPSDEEPAKVAQTMRNRFTDAFAPYAVQAARKGIPWTQVVTMASLIEREAAKSDKALIAGILWNRVRVGMPLQVDATLQYVKGNEDNGWWPVPKSEDKKLISDFNTYKSKGLPPHAIAEPSLASIEAAINPVATDCLYYLHDHDGVIHCSKTYAGQLSNVNKYLR